MASTMLRLRRISYKFMATLALFVLLMIVRFRLIHFSSDEYSTVMESKHEFKTRMNISAPHRKLLQQGEAEKAVEQPDRIWGDRSCSSDIAINQGPTLPLPNGIPTYTVEITNVCVSGCKIYAIHLHCGWFSSARLINPHVFKRLQYDNCLVNDGKPLLSGSTVSFTYANTFPYQLSVASAKC